MTRRTPSPGTRVAGALAFAVVGGLLSVVIVLSMHYVGTSLAPQSLAIRVMRLNAPVDALSREASVAPIDTSAAHQLAGSVVRISATAWDCGYGLLGTGLVVAPGRVLTNAHVVAGANDIVIESENGLLTEGAVVYFDPRHDLAVIAVAGLHAVPLYYDDSDLLDQSALFAGFPNGGPFEITNAVVTEHRAAETTNIYGYDRVRIDYWAVHGEVYPGSSGSPLVTADGDVAGLVFARSDGSSNTGFVLALSHLTPVIDTAADYIETVDTGPCIAPSD